MSPVISHLKMLSDKARLEAYKRAIFQTVHQGDVVVDIGTGTGILSFFALQAGAKKVYAIEAGPIIDIAKKLAKENGFHDSIEFIRQDSQKTEIPEPADVAITETIGVLGIDEGIVDLLSDARNRFLEKNGRIIPMTLNLMAIPISFQKGHPFLFLDRSLPEIRTATLRQIAANNVYRIDVGQAQLQYLSPPLPVYQTDFYSCEPIQFPLHMEGLFQVSMEGPFHGILAFPDIQLTRQEALSLFRDNRFLPSHWNISFFPVSEEIIVSQNETISFHLTFTEKNGLIWKVGIRGKTQERVWTHLSAFGLPSLRHLVSENQEK